MAHTYTNLWFHAIWSTKNREPIINKKLENILYKYMNSLFKEKGCYLAIINGMPDHIHCLFDLDPKYSISEIIKNIKGSSSHYLNENHFIDSKFEWQTGYAAFSVSQSSIDKTYRYIKYQKQHHRIKTFQEEYDKFILLNNKRREYL